MNSREEPDEGYEARWLARRAQAIRRCRRDPSVDSWTAMVSCALAYAYTEIGGWSNADQGWMRDAQTLVQEDLRKQIEMAYPGLISGWKIQLWLHGQRLEQACINDTPVARAACIAKTLYPNVPWPPPSQAPAWQREFWSAAMGMATEAKGS